MCPSRHPRGSRVGPQVLGRRLSQHTLGGFPPSPGQPPLSWPGWLPAPTLGSLLTLPGASGPLHRWHWVQQGLDKWTHGERNPQDSEAQLPAVWNPVQRAPGWSGQHNRPRAPLRSARGLRASRTLPLQLRRRACWLPRGLFLTWARLCCCRPPDDRMVKNWGCSCHGMQRALQMPAGVPWCSVAGALGLGTEV